MKKGTGTSQRQAGGGVKQSAKTKKPQRKSGSSACGERLKNSLSFNNSVKPNTTLGNRLEGEDSSVTMLARINAEKGEGGKTSKRARSTSQPCRRYKAAQREN